MQTTIEMKEIIDIRMRLGDLHYILTRRYSMIQREKITGGFQFFYYSYPSTYETNKIICGKWMFKTGSLRKRDWDNFNILVANGKAIALNKLN